MSKSVNFLLSFLLVGIILVSVQAGVPLRRQSIDELPKLSDALTVAKSPFEPVTLATSNPNARNDGSISTESPLDSIPTKSEGRTTRDAEGNDDEQEKDASTTSQDESTIPNSEITTTMKPEVATTDGEATTTEAELEATTKEDVDLQRLPVKTTSTPARSEPSSERSIEVEKLETTTAVVPSTSPTERPATETSEEPEVTTPSPPQSEPPTTTTTTTAAPTTEAPTTTPSSTPEVTSSSTTTTAAPTTEAPTTTPPSTPEATSPRTTTTTTTTAAPTTEAPITTPFSTPEVTSPSTTTTTSPPAEAPSSTPTPEDKASCNHLPTYESDELQKVFREEVTYKNGTIKGKFTYVNFDQRYRLVHYTRLPYGPVKIDLVEELSRPENASSQQSPPSADEVPNAVLQLRNILPNSLFGFPFVGPSSVASNNKPLEQERKGTTGDEKSNTYFYSTDSISTPNLLSSSVPVALLPGQRRASQPVNHLLADTLSQSYNENLQVGGRAAIVQSNPLLKSKQQENVVLSTINEQASLIGDSQEQQNTPYSLSSPVSSGPQVSEAPKSPNLVYTYLPQVPTQYQYSPLPLYTFNQPNYYQSAPRLQASLQPPQSNYNFKVKHPESGEFGHQQMHQPHNHEHYVAPFMFSQPPAMHNDQPEAARLKLKVKTSKSLSLNGQDAGLRGQKSAQLRAASNSPVNGPIQVHHSQQQQQLQQHHHRFGKQNQELKQTVNTSPVVYHVLRTPLGRIYNLPQYRQVHAMAYDHDS